jgi:hypothetical protein
MLDYDDDDYGYCGPSWDEDFTFIIPVKNGDSVEWPAGNFLEMKCRTSCRKYGYDDPPEYDDYTEMDSPFKTMTDEISFDGWRGAIETAYDYKFISGWQKEEMIKRYEEEYCD